VEKDERKAVRSGQGLVRGAAYWQRWRFLDILDRWSYWGANWFRVATASSLIGFTFPGGDSGIREAVASLLTGFARAMPKAGRWILTEDWQILLTEDGDMLEQE